MTQLVNMPAETITMVVAVVVAVSVIVTTVVKVWPFIRRVVWVINDMAGETARPGVPARPGIMERLYQLEQQSASEQSAHEDMMAGVDRVETRVALLSQRFDDFSVESYQDRQALWAIARQHHIERQGDDET